MKTYSFLAALLAAAGSAPVKAEPVTYGIDASHTKVYWEVRHFGTSTHRGRFDGVDGGIVIDRDKGTGEVQITIPTATVSSGVPALDAVLRNGSFLASESHPQAYFVAKQLRFDGSQLNTVRGEFTLRGVSKPLELSASNFNCRDDAMLKREVCGGDFVAEILRSDYGSTFGLPFVGDKVRLIISVEGIRQP
ncbi:YceI family protein [Piscinibacter terrae]|uniref:YceI family protein n=1 Tax=Piscinibacter terrae TaxID=2496871 RepID=A0A3N7IZR5_9BURK|nr:YceI family protein [Albitalea terrae]RQP24202.1 YceI family protein [Albitalea terrae]